MREEILLWWKQAERDVKTAMNCRRSGDYYAAAFFCQQAVEKALKALYMKKKKKSSGPTHSLTFLGRETGVARGKIPFLRKLTAEYFVSRYPDALRDVPANAYTEEDIDQYLKETGEVLQWVKRQINTS